MNYNLQYNYVLIAIPVVIIVLIILMKKSFIRFKNKEEKREYEKGKRGKRNLIIISRCIILLSLLIALSSPYTVKEEIVKGDYSLKILVDNSTSMDVFELSIVNELTKKLQDKIPVATREIASGTDSSIGDALINNMQGDDNILLVSDGQNNRGKELGDVMFFANLLNTTVSALNLNPVKDDYSVAIEGPSQAITGTENTFYIRLNKVRNPPDYAVSVAVDGTPVTLAKTGENLFEFTEIFSQGYHKITATINSNDYFEGNNVYYKTLHVLPKPKVLYVTEKSSRLLDMLKKTYTLYEKEYLPDDLSDYSSVIIDDISIDKLEDNVDLLSDYVIEGNGLFVIGGESSFDRGGYANSLFETLLPVRVGEAGKGGELSTNIVFVIDISESTGLGFGKRSASKKVDVEKSLAIEILNGISLYDRVGAVAFNHKAYRLSKLGMLAENKGNITKKISSLHDTGGTVVYAGLRQAEFMLRSALGSKNIILISDGVDSIPGLSVNIAKELAEKGVRIYSIGVGEGTNSAFLQTLSLETGGTYFEPTETQKLKILFGEREEIPPGDIESLVLFNANHFITQGINLNADATGYNLVVKKSAAQMLVSMGDGKPILSVWRYGLGRVVALSTDDGEKWASQLLSRENSKLFTRALNWAIKDPQRNLKFNIRVKDTHLGDTSTIVIYSDKKPVSKEVDFEKIEENKYMAYYTPEETGYREFFNALIATSYNTEYQNLGLNPDLRDLTAITGGKMFDIDDADELVDFIKANSIRKKTTPLYIRWPFIIFALAILLTEIFLRRIMDNRRK